MSSFGSHGVLTAYTTVCNNLSPRKKLLNKHSLVEHPNSIALKQSFSGILISFGKSLLQNVYGLKFSIYKIIPEFNPQEIRWILNKISIRHFTWYQTKHLVSQKKPRQSIIIKNTSNQWLNEKWFSTSWLKFKEENTQSTDVWSDWSAKFVDHILLLITRCNSNYSVLLLRSIRSLC